MADDVPAALNCDGLRTKQILNNLLSNAVKFTDQGGVGIEVERRGAELLMHVVDSGPGIEPGVARADLREIPPGQRPRQLPARRHRPGSALSRALAELMGAARARIHLGRGSRFTLVLPLA